jgi:N-dimethylarginine dimethylaminohydrolase
MDAVAEPYGPRILCVVARAGSVTGMEAPAFGSASMTGALRRVLVRPPLPEDVARWREAGWRAEPDPVVAGREHEAFCLLLEEAGAEVVVSRHDRGNPDALYPYDPVLVGAEGAVLLRPGKAGRRSEPAALAPELEAAGVPIAGIVTQPALAEGGDTLWLDDETLLVGVGYRTNEEALAELRRAFPGVEVVPFDLPHWNGDSEVLHLLSFISPLDRDLAVVYPRLAPVRLLRLLAERGIRVVEVPEDEFVSQGPNVLALGPRRALGLDGNPKTRKRMERAGVDVTVYRGDEISRKGDGGPTCLTRPLLRT